MGKMIWYFWSLDNVYFLFFEALNDDYEVQGFFRASFLHLIKDTDNMSSHAAQIF